VVLYWNLGQFGYIFRLLTEGLKLWKKHPKISQKFKLLIDSTSLRYLGALKKFCKINLNEKCHRLVCFSGLEDSFLIGVLVPKGKN
jgi:hypothetical protein